MLLRNWAGNYTYSTLNVLYPESVDEAAALVKRHARLRVLGSRHSFNAIADSTAVLLSLARLPRKIDIDENRRQATISANVTYGDLCPVLHAAGYALHNMASLPHISVVGAWMTATHGSGVGNRNLAAQAAGLKLVRADGEIVILTREQDGDSFEGAVVGLGCLGAVVEATLDLMPAFELAQHVYLNLPITRLEADFDAIMSSGYSVSLFTDWTGDAINQVWLKRRIDADTTAPVDNFFGALPATREMHPIGELSPEACTHQLGAAGPWHERLPHFRIDATPSAGTELQSEFFVPRSAAVDAIRAVALLRDHISPHLLISEIRTIAADELWMSPCYRQNSVGIHFTWKQDWPSVQAVLPRIEAALEPFGARPHWGKLFTMPPERLQPLCPNLPRFRDLVRRFDPNGKFRNQFVQANLYGDEGAS